MFQDFLFGTGSSQFVISNHSTLRLTSVIMPTKNKLGRSHEHSPDVTHRLPRH